MFKSYAEKVEKTIGKFEDTDQNAKYYTCCCGCKKLAESQVTVLPIKIQLENKKSYWLPDSEGKRTRTACTWSKKKGPWPFVILYQIFCCLGKENKLI